MGWWLTPAIPGWDMELGHLQWVFSQSSSKHVIFQASLDYGVKTLSQQNTHTNKKKKTYSKTNVSTEQREHKTESKKKNQQFQ